jgi:hypothetical protein
MICLALVLVGGSKSNQRFPLDSIRIIVHELRLGSSKLISMRFPPACNLLCRKTTLTTKPSSNTAANKFQYDFANHIHKADSVLVTYTSTHLVTRQVQHDNRYNTTKAGIFFRRLPRYISCLCLLKSLPSGSSSGCFLEKIIIYSIADIMSIGNTINPCMC